MSLPERFEINGVELTGIYCPQNVIVPPVPSERMSLARKPVRRGLPVAYLVYSEVIVAEVAAFWETIVGSVTDLMMLDPVHSTGTIDRSGTIYHSHMEYTSGIVQPMGMDESMYTRAGILSTGQLAHAITGGDTIVRITHLRAS